MKRTLSIICLMFASTSSIGSNACLIDGLTVFQKEPCPTQEAKNMTRDMRVYRERKARERRDIANHEKATKEALDERLRIVDLEHRNSPEGKADRRARQMRNIAIDNAATLRSIDNALQ